MFADTDGDTLLIYESGESPLDAFVTSYTAMKCKRDHPRLRKLFGLEVVPCVISVDWLLVQMMRFHVACHQYTFIGLCTSCNNWISESRNIRSKLSCQKNIFNCITIPMRKCFAVKMSRYHESRPPSSTAAHIDCSLQTIASSFAP